MPKTILERGDGEIWFRSTAVHMYGCVIIGARSSPSLPSPPSPHLLVLSRSLMPRLALPRISPSTSSLPDPLSPVSLPQHPCPFPILPPPALWELRTMQPPYPPYPRTHISTWNFPDAPQSLFVSTTILSGRAQQKTPPPPAPPHVFKAELLLTKL